MSWTFKIILCRIYLQCRRKGCLLSVYLTSGSSTALGKRSTWACKLGRREGMNSTFFTQSLFVLPVLWKELGRRVLLSVRELFPHCGFKIWNQPSMHPRPRVLRTRIICLTLDMENIWMSPLLTPMLQPLKCCHTGNPAPLPYNLSEPSILIEEGTSTCIVQVHSGEWRALESTVSKQMQAL